MDSRPALIVNLSAGTNEKHVETIVELFRANGLEPRVSLARPGMDIVELTRAALHEGSTTIVAGGGDGTINAIASLLAGTENVLGVLPIGTFNHFAKDLQIPLELEAAVKNIVTGQMVCVDLGKVNDRVFVNNSSLGLYSLLVRERQQQQRKGHSKLLALVLASLKVLRRYPFMSVRLIADGKEITRRTALVFVGNNEYEMEGLKAGSRASLSMGRLFVTVLRHRGRAQLLYLCLCVLFGWRKKKEYVDTLCAKELWVETRHKRVNVTMDGEVIVMTTPLHYRLLPASLRVIVPPRKE